MKLLLMIMALFEGVTGIVLLLVPARSVPLLIGVPLDTPAGLVAGRIAGAALIALAIACWQARNGERGGAATAVVAAMLFYNEAAAFLFVYASVRLQLQSPFIWPAFLIHQALAGWCLVNLWVTRSRQAKAAVAEASALSAE